MASHNSDITLYTTQTPNGIKISITLEELGYVSCASFFNTKTTKTLCESYGSSFSDPNECLKKSKESRSCVTQNYMCSFRTSLCEASQGIKHSSNIRNRRRHQAQQPFHYISTPYFDPS
jgi:hypothetical protein